jgi:hypothetical protein
MVLPVRVFTKICILKLGVGRNRCGEPNQFFAGRVNFGVCELSKRYTARENSLQNERTIFVDLPKN